MNLRDEITLPLSLKNEHYKGEGAQNNSKAMQYPIIGVCEKYYLAQRT